MTLVLSALMAFLSLLGIVYLWWSTPALIVENLFMTLILLTINGLFGINVLLELRDLGLPLPLLGKPKPGQAGFTGGPVSAGDGSLRDAGVVEHVSYFESSVGHPNHLVVTLRPAPDAAPRTLIFHGDVRDQFPLGRKVEVTYRKDDDAVSLLERRYV